MKNNILVTLALISSIVLSIGNLNAETIAVETFAKEVTAIEDACCSNPDQIYKTGKSTFKRGLEEIKNSESYLEFQQACLNAKNVVYTHENAFNENFPAFSSYPCGSKLVQSSSRAGYIKITCEVIVELTCAKP